MYENRIAVVYLPFLVAKKPVGNSLKQSQDDDEWLEIGKGNKSSIMLTVFFTSVTKIT